MEGQSSWKPMSCTYLLALVFCASQPTSQQSQRDTDPLLPWDGIDSIVPICQLKLQCL